MYDLIVVGGGPAGLAAAYEAYKNGISNIIIIEREKELGGILNQCIHSGFGLQTFKEELTGPEYAGKFIELIKNTNVEIMLDTMVLEIEKCKKVHVINQKDGYQILEGKAIILAMGCRERTRGAISIPGDRPSGIFTAGLAQRYINIQGYMPGEKVVILGSGDIGLIMARRMSLEGAKVEAVVEIMPYSNGLNRNIIQCLEDYSIPLYLSHTIIDIVGKSRLKSVIISEVDNNKKPIKGTEKEFKCDTLLLSVGLIPENELSSSIGIDSDIRTNGIIVNESMETSISGIFACGNVVHVHDLVDFVTEESKNAGKSAAKYIISNNSIKLKSVNIINGDNINYTVPQKLNLENIEENLVIFMRVNNIYENKDIVIISSDIEIARFKKDHLAPSEMIKLILTKNQLTKVNADMEVFLEDRKDIDMMTKPLPTNNREDEGDIYKKLRCICCPKGCYLKVDIKNKKVLGNNCEKGEAYGLSEFTNPVRTITTTVKVRNGKVNIIPVKTNGGIPKSLNYKCIEIINGIYVEAPINIGDVIYKDILKTGIDIVSCKNVDLSNDQSMLNS